MIEERPWGTYEILYEDESCKVKKIVVHPGKRLSYQYHEKRDEHWIITQGIAYINIDGRISTRHPGENIFIPRLSKHRVTPLSSNFDGNLEFIEIQTGDSFDESDIVRIEDDFNRN